MTEQTTDLVVFGEESVDLGEITGNPKFEGMEVAYLQEIVEGLREERGEDVARNFVYLLRSFAGGKSDTDLDSIGYEDLEIADDMFGDDDEEESDISMASYESDPARNVKLTQALTKNLPKGVGGGVFFDSVAGEVVAQTWNEEEERPQRVDVHILAWHQSRAYFEPGSNSPQCTSQDGVINRFGAPCKPCPLRVSSEQGRAAPCTNQVKAVVCSSDLKHLYKISFSKTSFRDGQVLGKKHKARPNNHAVVVKLTVEQKKNTRGEWYTPQGVVTNSKATGATEKALRLLNQAYVGFFKRLKSRLYEKHQAWKAEQQGLPAGQEKKQLGPGTGNAGVDGKFFGKNTQEKPDVDTGAVEEVDLSSIG